MSTDKRRFDLLTSAALPRQLPAPSAPPVHAAPRRSDRTRPRWTLARALAELGPFLPHTILLGVAADGLPVLLDLSDPTPGPLLVLGQPRGRQRFLWQTARTLAATHPQADVRFVLLSPVLQPWQTLSRQPQALGVASAFSRQAETLLHAAEAWGYSLRRRAGSQYLLLLLDDLPTLAAHCNEETFLLLGDLLAHGPAHGIWPIVTAAPASLARLPQTWQHALAARIHHQGNTSYPASDEFLLADGNGGLRFSLVH